MAKRGITEADLEKELNLLRQDFGCLDHIIEASDLVEHIGCADALPEFQTACVLRLVQRLQPGKRGEALLAVFNLLEGYTQFDLAEERRWAYANDCLPHGEEVSRTSNTLSKRELSTINLLAKQMMVHEDELPKILRGVTENYVLPIPRFTIRRKLTDEPTVKDLLHRVADGIEEGNADRCEGNVDRRKVLAVITGTASSSGDVETARLEAAKQEAARQEAAKQEAARQEAARQEAARLEAAKQETARLEVAKQEAARQEAARQEAAKREAAKQEAARQEAARQEAEKREAAKQEAARQEAARQEAEKREAARQEAAKQEAARQEAARKAIAAKSWELYNLYALNHKRAAQALYDIYKRDRSFARDVLDDIYKESSRDAADHLQYMLNEIKREDAEI